MLRLVPQFFFYELVFELKSKHDLVEFHKSNRYMFITFLKWCGGCFALHKHVGEYILVKVLFCQDVLN